LNDPIKITRSKSTPDSYRLKYSKSARKSPWEKLISSSASFLSSNGSKRSSTSGGGGDIVSPVATDRSTGEEHFCEERSPSTSRLSIRSFSNDDDDDVVVVVDDDDIHDHDVQLKGKKRSDSIFRGPTPTAHNIGGTFMDDDDDEIKTPLRPDALFRMQLTSSFDNTSVFARGKDDTNAHDIVVKNNNDGTRFVAVKSPSKDLYGSNDSPPDIIPGVSTDQTRNTIRTFFTFAEIRDKSHLMHLCIFAVFGSALRIMLGRIFGRDCEFPDAVNDFISHLSTCVTASGTTEQTGGALFLDLPANIVGSFAMGVLTPINHDIPPIPWLKPDHRLQDNAGLHFGIRVAFCGSLTTFASWNTQMIVMMVGRGTVLGRQIVPALFGYGLGLVCAISSFLMGRQAANFLYNRYITDTQNRSLPSELLTPATNHLRKPLNQEDCNDLMGPGDDDGGSFGSSGGDIENMAIRKINWINTKTTLGITEDIDESNRAFVPRVVILNMAKFRTLPSLCDIVNARYFYFFVVIVLFGLFVIGDYVLGIDFYRQVWISLLFALPGSLLRWNLSFWNGQLFISDERLNWVPWGTLTANVLGCIFSAIAQAMIFRFDDNNTNIRRLMLVALKTGLAGNISTVSTFVKEVVHLYEKFNNTRRAYIYAIGSIVLCCLLSLCIYLPLVLTL